MVEVEQLPAVTSNKSMFPNKIEHLTQSGKLQWTRLELTSGSFTELLAVKGSHPMTLFRIQLSLFSVVLLKVVVSGLREQHYPDTSVISYELCPDWLIFSLD